MRKSLFLQVLAQSLLAGDLTARPCISRFSWTLGRRWAWLPPLANRFAKAFKDGTRPRERDIIRFLSRDPGLTRAWRKDSKKLSVAHWLNQPQKMRPVPAARSWKVPPLESTGALARWLGVDVAELEWFADRKGLAGKQAISKLRHYYYTILAKRAGSLRLIEAPKVRLKQIQQKMLAEILSRIPPHPAAHGFVRERSIKTFVASHVGRRVVLRMDLKDFFPSFPATRIQAVFRTLGYPEAVADLLGGLCTSATPGDVWGRAAFGEDTLHLWESRAEAQALYSRRHLPQGAPTSPALANICSYRLDCRLTGLAKAAGAIYTRYADDLAFSGDLEFERVVERFAIHVAAILHEEGFQVHHRKTRIMRQGVRQHLAGLVTNKRLNIRRQDFDRLKAILTNCARTGPSAQNRESHPFFREHLEGRVGFMEMINAQKGAHVRALFERIHW
ncbi:MAG TPA: reverse transcriptase family protein [Candidatus Angelobacter sp.]|nr:reverse transcriptase family protein [Candidatus Angelobacter sp.]